MLRKIGIAGYRKIYLEKSPICELERAVNPGFCEKMEVTRVPQVGNPWLRLKICSSEKFRKLRKACG